MGWRVAESLGPTSTKGLLGEINASAPLRSKASDGSIGDEAHSSRTSDHNPNPQGVVCARDFTHDPGGGFDCQPFADWLRERILAKQPEQRIKYVIWNRRIMSGRGQEQPAGLWRPYSGTNPHTHHVHVSVRSPASYYDNAALWGWAQSDTAATEPAPPPDLVAPARPVPSAFPAVVPTWPLPKGHWFGPESSNAKNHSGFTAKDRPWVRYGVLLVRARGWLDAVDADRYTPDFAKQVMSAQVQYNVGNDGLIGPETWATLHEAP